MVPRFFMVIDTELTVPLTMVEGTDWEINWAPFPAVKVGVGEGVGVGGAGVAVGVGVAGTRVGVVPMPELQN